MSCNVGNTYVNFAKNNITKYMKLILEDRFNTNIFSSLLDVYIDVRYYNYYEIKYKNAESNINFYMRNKAKELISENENDSDDIKITFYLFKYMLYFDDVNSYDDLKSVVNEITDYRVNVLGINTEYEKELIQLIKDNIKKKNEFLNSFDSTRFELILNKTSIKNIFYSDIGYDIKFPKIYSEYSKNKVYNTGIVNEKKYFIMYYLISMTILKNVISSDFNKKYITDFCLSLFDKNEKFNRLLGVINNDCIKDSIIISFKYNEYLEYRDRINDLISSGYKTAVVLDDNYVVSEINNKKLEIFSYIITKEVMYKDIFDKEKLIIIDK